MARYIQRATTVALLLLGLSAQASQEVTIVVNREAGGPYSNISMRIRDALDDAGIKVRVEHKPGASGNIGHQHFQSLSSPALMVSGDSVVLNSVYFPQGYPAGAPRNLEPLTVLGIASTMIVSATHNSWESLRSRSHLFVGTSGGGNVSEFGAKALCDGMSCTFVNYKSYSGAINDLLGGRIDAYAVHVVGPIAGVGDKLKPVAVLSPLPNVMYPSIKPAKVNGSAVNMDGWVMLFGRNLNDKTRESVIKTVNTLFAGDELARWGFRSAEKQSAETLLLQSIKTVSR